MNILLVSSVTARLEQHFDTTDTSRQVRTSTEAETAMRFLRAGDTGREDANEVSHKEERGFLTDNLIIMPSIKGGLNLALKAAELPAKILQDFQRLNVQMSEGNLLLWMRYVQKYRVKMGGDSWADDAYVIQTLKNFIPESQLSVVFNAMKEKTKLHSFGVNLEKAAANAV
ncbi:Avirulence protein [Phytophthora megakarya]|uniref:Avirulence protein n=1 Tax=Phytophthora megakarya TaxID=4795 RepID=A0A225WGE8_9STRA|nr:Avirulence protein [Phytophthora megakarya]